MKDNNFHFNQVFLNTLDSKQLLSLSHLENISAFISEKSLSILLAKTSFAFLLISMFSYWFQMSFKSAFDVLPKDSKKEVQDVSTCGSKESIMDKKTFLKKVPLVTMWFANITLALLLSIRWIESGHFPLSNLYESLIFLSWSLTSIHLFLETLFYKKEQILGSTPTLTLGAITSPVALFTNAFATFSLPQEMQKVTVLVPALKSNWLIMHVSVMLISYAALLSGSLLAMAFLVVKFIDDNKIPSIVYTFITGFKESNYISLLTQFKLSKKLNPLTTYLPSDAKQEGVRKTTRALQVASPSLMTLMPAGLENEELESLGSTKETVSFLASNIEDVSPLQSKERTNIFDVRSKGVPTSLLGKEIKNFQFLDLSHILDNLSYRSIGLGFALLTIGILSGAVWANEAWGSYWSWDPKETWAFITWLVFALYLHTRLSKGWVGKESAFVASFGFVVIWFCYLGVNFFGKGLHSYGWFQQ